MPLDKLDIVRTLWTTLDRDADAVWPPPQDELDRRLRLDLLDERVEIPSWSKPTTARPS